VNGETVTSYRTNVVPGDDHSPGTEVIVDGYFAESTFRSAPYFNLRIDGITLLNAS
jgi:basic membrane protein A